MRLFHVSFLFIAAPWATRLVAARPHLYNHIEVQRSDSTIASTLTTAYLNNLPADEIITKRSITESSSSLSSAAAPVIRADTDTIPEENVRRNFDITDNQYSEDVASATTKERGKRGSHYKTRPEDISLNETPEKREIEARAENVSDVLLWPTTALPI